MPDEPASNPPPPSSLARLARLVFGELAWQPPGWLKRAAASARKSTRQASNYARQNPAMASAIAVAALAAVAAGWFGWRWYQNRPRPVETTFVVTAPPRTCYECEPPGSPNPLLVQFDASAAALSQVGKDVDPALQAIEMRPQAKGTWHWDDDRTLRFQPAEDWPIGTEYHVTFAKRGWLAPNLHLKEYDFDFESPAFAATIAGTEFHQDPIVARNKKVVTNVSFTHPVNPELFEKRVSLTLFEKVTDTMEKEKGKARFTVVYDKLRLHAYVYSEELPVPDKAGRLAIRIDPGVAAMRGGNATKEKLESNVAVPGLYSLAVQSLSLEIARDEREEPSQALVVAMNHSVLEQDMAQAVTAWRLPLKHPDPRRQAQFESSAKGAYRWSDADVTPKVLETSERLPLQQIPGDREHYELHSFRHEAEPGQFIYVKVNRGLKSFGGYLLEHSLERTFEVPAYPMEVRIAQQGSLLSLGGSKTLTILSRDVPAIRVEVARLLPQQIQHLVSQTDGSFSAPVFGNWRFDAANITERFTKTLKLPKLKAGTAHYEGLPLAEYLADDAANRRGIFFVKVQAWDAEHDRPLSGGQDTTDSRLIVLTDLGLLAKRSLDGSQDLFVQSVRSGTPLADVSLEILGRNGLPVLNATTDAEGHARFADLKSFQREQEPVLYLARRGGDLAFLPVQDKDRRLDLSRFDVGGVDNRVDQGTLSAYLFSDRGLYRPGEEIHIGAIVRSQDWKRLTNEVPLRLEVQDPRGITVRSESFRPGPAGFGEIRHATRETSAAGNYTFSLSIVRNRGGVDLIGSTIVQVRDFLPDRLRMSTRFSTESPQGWVSPNDLTAKVNLANLFGTPAANRRVTARMTLSAAFPEFKAYADYRFYDPQAAREGFREDLAAGKTDERGEATFDLNLQRFARATYRLHLATEGFEADGGRGVSSEAAQLVSNMPFLVGWKADGGLEYVSLGARRTVSLIAIDPQLQRKNVPSLKLLRLETRSVSTLVRRNDGTFQYESRRRSIALGEKALEIGANGFQLALDTATPGSFAYVVQDSQGQDLARIEYRVAGQANLTRTMEKDAQLQIALARGDYSAGDEIEMQIQAPYTGAGLITIERDKVYAWRWFRTTTTSSLQRIKLPAGIEGNAYVSVAFVRDPGSPEIYSSPLSYGVQPFSINLDSRRNEVTLRQPELVKPGGTLRLGYSTARPARIAIFAVDEGVLQVARYRTPDPLAHFFQKRSLDVATTQILDLILPEFRNGEGAAAPGGDQESALGRHLNPFRRKGEKPVVWWSGILDADTTARNVEFTVPDYFNGTLRVIAVAVADEAIGVKEGKTLVRGDFVLSPNTPTTVTPGDEFEVSVGVANNLAGSGPSAQLRVALEADSGLEIMGDREQVLSIAENREGSARFRLRTRDKLGPAELRFTASLGSSTLNRRVDLSVRPATPYMTTLTAGTVRNGERDQAVQRNIYPEHHVRRASVSLLPLGIAHGLTTYLGNYPYACTEQIVSQAMPAMLLAERPEFGYVKTQPGADLDDLIDELRMRQNDEGAYRLWPGGNEVVEFVSVYTQHFLIEATERGRRVPADLLQRGNEYLRTLARRDGNNLIEERNSAYAIYLLTRQGQVMSAEAATLRKRLNGRYKNEWPQDLAALWLAAAFQAMRQEADAQRTLDPLRYGIVDASNDPYDDAMTRDAFILYVVGRHFPSKLTHLPPEVLQNLVERVTANTYHSLSAGTTLLALATYTGATQANEAPLLSIAEVLRDKTLKPLDLQRELFPRVDVSDRAGKVRFGNGSDLNAYTLLEEAGFDRTPPKEAISKGFEILREYTDEAGKPTGTIALGAQVDVHVKFRALNDKAVANVALVDLFPGGFELVIPPQETRDEFHQASPGDADYGGGSYTSWNCAFCVGRAPGTLSYADPREDRVVFYVTAMRDIQEVRYRIKATNVGRYVVPPAYGESMYDRSAVARSVASQIEVRVP